MTAPWWEAFFDGEYMRFWSERDDARASAEVDAIAKLLGLSPGARVLDAPCGWGRLSSCLARRGFDVVGLDQAQALLDRAVADRGGATNPAYRRHDLREPFPEAGFDAALNIFSSVGYGTEEDDLAIVTNLARAVREGGRVLVDTMHRDAAVALSGRGPPPPTRLADGTIFMEQPVFDPVAGRVDTVWHWAGPGGVGSKPASFRIYSITELCRLVERAGLEIVSLHSGCSSEPYRWNPANGGGRVGVLAVR